MIGKYNSFKEIDQDLKILALEREINKEYTKYSIQELKTYFYPFNLIRSFDGFVVKVVIPLILTKVFKKKRLSQ
ncbi:DUF6327 family protein [uncultured Eudoraea sp.]|uniref:DUF6327 family protein n=1 Tax=uncultured Eudoraea sp. TaxID=1035614 RepID=UPI0034582482